MRPILSLFLVIAVCSCSTDGQDEALPHGTLSTLPTSTTGSVLVTTGEIRTFTFQGDSMDPAIVNGQSINVAIAAPNAPPLPVRGDIVVFRKPDGSGDETALAKRVVGLPGETIEITSCVVYLDSQPLGEPYLDHDREAAEGCGPDTPATVVPEGSVFVLGDYRARSADSRVFGPVPTDLITGTVQI